MDSYPTEPLTVETSETFSLEICPGTTTSTCSQESEDGHTPSSSQDGKDQSGQSPVPANPSASQDALREWATRGTYGPLFDGLSTSAALQSSLESRLHQRLDCNGSPEYVLTWKSWGMPSGAPICALRAYPRPTKGSAFTGWRSPTVVERNKPYNGTLYMTVNGTVRRRNSNGTSSDMGLGATTRHLIDSGITTEWSNLTGDAGGLRLWIMGLTRPSTLKPASYTALGALYRHGELVRFGRRWAGRNGATHYHAAVRPLIDWGLAERFGDFIRLTGPGWEHFRGREAMGL